MYTPFLQQYDCMAPHYGSVALTCSGLRKRKSAAFHSDSEGEGEKNGEEGDGAASAPGRYSPPLLQSHQVVGEATIEAQADVRALWAERQRIRAALGTGAPPPSTAPSPFVRIARPAASRPAALYRHARSHATRVCARMGQRHVCESMFVSDVGTCACVLCVCLL